MTPSPPEQERPDLRSFQTWMQTFIVSPGTADEALHAAEQLSGFSEGSAQRLVKPSPTLDEMERLMIYRQMYPLRMEEALSVDFPVCKELLGRRNFMNLVEDYVEVHPSTSWTLDHLGRQFVGFVQGHKLCEKFPGLYDLARLEQALCEAFNADDSVTLDMESLAEIDPEAYFDACFEPIPALRLISLESNANDLYLAFNRDEELPDHEPAPQKVVVWRNDNQIWRMPISEAAALMLASLMEGTPMGDALSMVLEKHTLDEQQPFEWFRTWVGEGFFQTLHVPTNPSIPETSNVHPI